MTLTIDLQPETEQRLRERAAREGLHIEKVAAAILADALESEAQDLAQALQGIQRGLDDFSAGRCRSFQEFAAEQRLKHGLQPEA